MDQATTNPPLRISLLGSFDVRLADAIVLDRSWNRAKAKALLKLLSLSRGHALHREQVLDALWPDLDATAGGSNLRKTLHYLRTRLHDHGVADPVVTVAAEMLALSGAVRVDVDEFRAAARAARDGVHSPELYERALGLYRGELLPEDIYAEWAAGPREELRTLHRQLLAETAALCEGRGAPEGAIDHLQRLVRDDPLDEDAHRSLMRLYAEGGSRHRALRQYERCREALERELAVDPAPETEILRRRILEAEAPSGGHNRRPPAGKHRALPPMYGREKELEFAGDILDAAADGRGRALFVSGAAGMGKSRFVQQVVTTAEEAGALAITGRSYELEASVAYQPVREVLRQLIEAVADDAVRESIRGSLYLKRLLPNASVGGYSPADPAVLQAELFEEVAGLFRTLAARRLVLVCFEDLHAADGPSLGLLHVLARRLAAERFVLLATYRSEDVAAGGPVSELVSSLRQAGLAESLDLGPLPDGVMELVVGSVFGGPAEATLVRDVTRRAEGNPLFALELVHTVTEQRWARRVDGRWERSERDPAPLPMAVRDMVERRVRGLAEESRAVVAAASVLGRDFDYGVLRRAVPVPEHAVLDALDDGIEAFLLEETPTGYRFRHDLVREAVYRGLARARRQQLHRSVATALAEMRTEDGMTAEQIGYHFGLSDDPARAIPFLHDAARGAASVFANEQAIALYEQASAIARSIRWPRLGELLEELGDLRSRVGDAATSVQLLREALALFTTAGEEESVLRVRAKAALGLVVLGRGDEAAELLGAHLESWRRLIGQELGEQFASFGVSAAYHVLANLRWQRGQHREALEAAEKAILAAEASQDVRPRARAYESLALACHALGDWEKGVEYELSREALGIAGFETDVALDGHL